MENKTYPFEQDLNNFADSANDAAKDTKAALADKAVAFKEKTQELGRAAIDKIDDGRVGAANALRGTASSLHGNADKLPNVPVLAHSAARRVESMADYLESKDTRQFMGDLGEVVKRNPMPSLIIAAVAGFFIGKSIRSSR